MVTWEGFQAWLRWATKTRRPRSEFAATTRRSLRGLTRGAGITTPERLPSLHPRLAPTAHFHAVPGVPGIRFLILCNNFKTAGQKTLREHHRQGDTRASLIPTIPSNAACIVLGHQIQILATISAILKRALAAKSSMMSSAPPGIAMAGTCFESASTFYMLGLMLGLNKGTRICGWTFSPGPED